MKVSVQIPSFTFPGGDAAIGPALRDCARVCEDAGVDTLWVMDHFFQLADIGPVDSPMLESYTTLSHLAAVTERLRFGTMVTGVVYRPPGLLAKTVTTLDVLSGGRAWLGIGASWYEQEAVGLGFGFPSTTERFERLDETLRIVRQMFDGDRTPFEGKHYSLPEPINSPQPVGRVPILVGGMGARKTMRLVARYADACNFFAMAGPDALRDALAALERACESEGRDASEIEKTALVIPTGDVPAACRDLAAMGFTHVVLSLLPGEGDFGTFVREAVPALQAI